MNQGVEHLDDLTIDLKAMRDIDNVLEQRSDIRGDRSLAVSGRSIQQDRGARIDRRAELAKQVLADHEVAERLVNGPLIKSFVADRLARDLQAKSIQGHWGRT